MGRTKTLTTHTYAILEDNTIEMWVPGQPQTEPPVLRQPYNPETGEAFKSKEDAETWIANYIAEAVRLQEAVVE